MDKGDVQSALEAGTALAKPITNPHPESRHAVLIPPGHSLSYLEKVEAPARRVAKLTMEDAESFVRYWTEIGHGADSHVYAKMEPVSFVAVFNDHGPLGPGWRDYRCEYKPKYSPEWQAWSGHDRQPFAGNEAFAIWLEDNAVDVVKPDPARMMDIALNMKVSQMQAFANAVRLSDGNIDFSYANEVNSSSKSGSSRVTIPEMFTIEVPVFAGLTAKKYRVDARFRFRLQNPGGLTIRFELVRPRKVIEAAYRDLVATIEKGADIKILFGSPE